MSPSLDERPHHLVEMEVGPADSARRDPDDGVGRLLDLRVGNRVDANVALAVPSDCSHGFLLEGDRAKGHRLERCRVPRVPRSGVLKRRARVSAVAVGERTAVSDSEEVTVEEREPEGSYAESREKQAEFEEDSYAKRRATGRKRSTMSSRARSQRSPRNLPAPAHDVKRGAVRVGTSGWSYTDWRGVVYPACGPAAQLVRVLRGAVRHRRAQQHLLPTAAGRDRRDVGAAGAAGIPLRREARGVRLTPDEAA